MYPALFSIHLLSSLWVAEIKTRSFYNMNICTVFLWNLLDPIVPRQGQTLGSRCDCRDPSPRMRRGQTYINALCIYTVISLVPLQVHLHLGTSRSPCLFVVLHRYKTHPVRRINLLVQTLSLNCTLFMSPR